MLSRVQNVFGFVKNLLWEEEDGDLFQDVKEDDRSKNVDSADVIIKRCGTITAIKSNCALIDNEFGCDISCISEKLEVNSRVWFDLKSLPNGGMIVTSIGLLANETDEEIWDHCSATVIKICDQEITLSNGMKCKLDQMSLASEYVAMEGDEVQFEKRTIGQRDIIYQLKPAMRLPMVGFISEYKAGNGLIDCSTGTVWFTSDVLEKSYNPLKDDKVKCTAIINNQEGKSGKRAIDIKFIQNDKDYQDLKNSDDYSGVELSSNTDFKEVQIGDNSKIVTVSITNKGDIPVILKSGSFRRPQNQVFVKDGKFPMKIMPLNSVSVVFGLKPEFIGPNSEIYDFFFNGFRISRCIEMVVNSPMVEHLQPLPRLNSKPTGDSYTYGTSPFRRKHFRRQTERFLIPQRMKEIVLIDSRAAVIKQMEQEFPIFTESLSNLNYATKFHYLLFLEELFLNLEADKLSKQHVFFKHQGKYLTLTMPGIMEQRPSPIVGDQVVVTQPWLNQKEGHVGFICKVQRDLIHIDFNDAFKASYQETDCNIEFRCQMSVFTMMHRAVNQAVRSIAPILFPTECNASPPLFDFKEDDMGWFNKDLNKYQRKSIVNVLRGESRPLPYIIFGPPGTGKTSTVTELVLQIMRYGNARILVTAPSNSAANLLTRKLILSGNLRTHELVRVVSFTRFSEIVEEDIADYCRTAGDDDDEYDVALGYHKITVGTCTSAGALHDTLKPGHFSHIIVDEAGCASEPQILIPLTFMSKNGVLVLVGDSQQLGPTLYACLARMYGLAESFLLRLMNRELYSWDPAKFPETDGYDPKLITCLKLNYRSVPDILKVPSRLFYHSALIPVITGTSGREAAIIEGFFKLCPVRDRPSSLIFHGVRGDNIREFDSPSWLNPQEIFHAFKYVKILLQMGVLSSEIGIISPYRKQVQKIREILKELDIQDLKIGSVEEFQGQERQVIILSAVRSSAKMIEVHNKHHLGFLCDPRRFNVSVTRARSLLIVIGNPHFLCIDSCWRALLIQCLDMGTYTGCNLPVEFNTTITTNELADKIDDIELEEFSDCDDSVDPDEPW